MLSNRFVIVVPLYNAAPFLPLCLRSILGQDHPDLGVIVRDDCSTDDSRDVVRNMLGIEGREQTRTRIGKVDVIFVANERKLYAGGNTYESVLQFVENPHAIVGVVDGDDYLLRSDAARRVAQAYDGPDRWLVWTQHSTTSGAPGVSKPLPGADVIYSGREYWSVTHFRTCRAGLFHKLDRADLLDPFDEGCYYQTVGDAAYLFPVTEMAGPDRTYFLNETLYVYRDNLPTNDHRLNRDNALQRGRYLRFRARRYQRIDSYV